MHDQYADCTVSQLFTNITGGGVNHYISINYTLFGRGFTGYLKQKSYRNISGATSVLKMMGKCARMKCMLKKKLSKSNKMF